MLSLKLHAISVALSMTGLACMRTSPDKQPVDTVNTTAGTSEHNSAARSIKDM
jgi:hypothetical protein